MFQMTSLMLHEKRGHYAHLNAIGELCAQFRRGILATMRELGPDNVIQIVEAYHKLHPEAAASAWHPDALAGMDSPEWQQLYVNAEHDGEVGVITIGRESYGWDVDRELNRAIDWLKSEGIEKVIVSGDFHISTQMVGAETGDFYPALEDIEAGLAITTGWPSTGRRFHDEFQTSVAFIGGKRCLGGMLELLVHCHYLVAVEDAQLGWPEVTLPVVPGMEGCHWPLRRSDTEHWPQILQMLLGGSPVRARDASGWLIDHAGPMDEVLGMAWKLASGGDHGVTRRPLETGALKGLPDSVTGLPHPDSPLTETAREAIMRCVQDSCRASLADALPIQARQAAEFLASTPCRQGMVGAEYQKTMAV
jgi:enoyl-CoA hydratase/carnithine racemase